jgi:hypothetical protein
VLKYPIRDEVALTVGNLVYHKTARNFGPVMATAATTTTVQVDRVVDAGATQVRTARTAHELLGLRALVGGPTSATSRTAAMGRSCCRAPQRLLPPRQPIQGVVAVQP